MSKPIFRFLGLTLRLREARRVFSNGRDRLGCLVGTILDYYTTYPDRMRLLSVIIALHSDLFRQVLNAVLKSGLPIPIDILVEGMEKNELKKMNPILAWWNIMGVCMFNFDANNVVRKITAPIPLPSPDINTRKRELVEFLSGGMVEKI